MLLLRRHQRALLITVLFLFPLPLFAWQAQQLGNIQGEIWIARGDQPTIRIMVELQVRGAAITTTYSDDEGKFGFYALPANPYHVVIRDEHFEPVDLLINVNPLNTTNNIARLTLKPREAGNQQLTPSVAGGNPYLVNAEEYNQRFPKKVVQEFEKGAKSRRDGDVEAAIKHYKKAILIAPDFYPAHNDLGAAYLQQGNFQLAQTEFEQAQKMSPNDADSYFNLANVALITRHYPEGMKLVEQGLAKQPTSATGLFVKGCLDRRVGKFGEAEQSLRDALHQDPSLANAHLELVNLYRQEENRPQMVAELASFLKLYPGNPMAPRVREALQKLTAPPSK